MSVSGENTLIKRISEEEGFTTRSHSSLAGGSINQVYLLDTSEGKKVLKVNDSRKYPGMFAAEKKGLDELEKSKTVDVPRVLACGEVDSHAYLLLKYKKGTAEKSHFWNRFAEDLAALHKTSAPEFGFKDSNYIGSLPQYNGKEKSAAEFYISQRLEPQFKMAVEKGFSFDGIHLLYRNISEEIPDEAPSLIHGDLWAGNYITNEEGLPCLIDPAVSYAPREMDLSMMKLFGGFPEEVFSHYNSLFPLGNGFKERIEIWQLYYLLVHLNIFGSSYLHPVQKIVRRFS